MFDCQVCSKETSPYYDRGGIAIYHGDCRPILPTLEERSVQMVLADLPYGTSYCQWDTVIPLESLWDQFGRLVDGNGAMVFTSNQPFTTTLIASKLPWFKYEWIWNKENPSNFGNCNRQPLKQHENVLVFARGQNPYFPVKTLGQPNHAQGKRGRNRTAETARIDPSKAADDTTGMKYPKTILHFPKHSSQCKHHPTEKPVDLLSYLVQTYTIVGHTILDPTMGSGSTLVAAGLLGRRAIGIEIEERYCELAARRLDKEIDWQTAPAVKGSLFKKVLDKREEVE